VRERLTWNPIYPAPYESAWSVFVKLMALNFCEPLDIARSIVWSSIPVPTRLEFRESSWIDFERYGRLLGVAPVRLRSGFLDQLGFPKISGDSDVHGVRFCPECLKHGYHSVLFDLALVAECPVHRCNLTPACFSCSWTVAAKGLIRIARPSRIPGGVIHDAHWRSDVYSSTCKHVYFDPDLVPFVDGKDREAGEETKKISNDFVLWWRRAFTTDRTRSVCIASLAQFSFPEDQQTILGWELDLARTIAGPCPWPTSVLPLPADLVCLPFKRTNAKRVNCRIPLKSELGSIYKTIRRRLFSKYVKPSHQACWDELSSYDRDSSLAISNRRVCSLVLAFMTWRMSVEGFSNIEGFRVHRPINDFVWSFISPDSEPIQIATSWYVQFFAVLGEIQAKLRNGGHFYIERSDFGARFAGSIFESTSFEQTTREPDGWLLVFPNKDDQLRKAWGRCAAKRKGGHTMISVFAWNSLMNGAWTGRYSERNSPRLLFRVKDDSPMMRDGRSYSYLTF